MQCSVPTGRSSGPWKLMSAVCADVPITQAKWKNQLYSGSGVPGKSSGSGALRRRAV